MSVWKILIILIMINFACTLYAEVQYYIVTKSTEGLLSFQKGNDYKIKAPIKKVTIPERIFLEVVSTKFIKGAEYKIVRSASSGNLYFVSNKWLQNGTIPDPNIKTFDLNAHLNTIWGAPISSNLQPPSEDCQPQSQPQPQTDAVQAKVDSLISQVISLPDDGLRPGINTYQKIKSYAKELVKEGKTPRQCDNILKAKGYKSLEPPPLIWSGVKMSKRASLVYEHAKASLAKIKEVSNQNRTSDDKTNLTNPHFIHEDMSPEIMACIAFIEVGDLNPHAINYTYCKPYDPDTSSTAHGLGQITKTTFFDLREYKKDKTNLLPITTRDDRYKNYTSQDLFDALNDDVPLQMEIMARTMNYKIKITEQPDATSLDNIYAGVAAYDTDNQNCYHQLFKACYACMNTDAGKNSPYRCLRTIGKTRKEREECQ